MRLGHNGSLILALTVLFASSSGLLAASRTPYSHHTHHAQAAATTSHHHGSSTAHKTGAHKSASHHSNVHTRLAQMQIDPTRVENIQQALTGAGIFHGAPTGRWDAETREAMSRFQAANGFGATGLPDAKSLMKLGLGPHPLPVELDKTPSTSQNPEPAPEGPAHRDQALSTTVGEAQRPAANPGPSDPPDKH
ncbi:MAG TPA: peptidoglycan-binding domain-containing protein [Terriglobia bacterium]